MFFVKKIKSESRKKNKINRAIPPINTRGVTKRLFVGPPGAPGGRRSARGLYLKSLLGLRNRSYFLKNQEMSGN
jgi:hypothetical protein